MSTDSCPGAADLRLVGDPVDTLTGAAIDRTLDFRLVGPIELAWYRYYDSSQAGRSFGLGNGCAHEYDRSLTREASGLVYREYAGREYRFPLPEADGLECALNGMRLLRRSATCYWLQRRA